jgi:hypothetical protein
MQCGRLAAAVRSFSCCKASVGYALPGTPVVPYAGAVPDGGRQGFMAAVAVTAPIV